MIAPLIDKVLELIIEVSEAEIVPRFNRLANEDIDIKTGPDDFVTIVDRRVEQLLQSRLMDLVPGAQVLGEEAVGSRTIAMEVLDEDGLIWTLDPLDGTKEFVAGRSDFGVMISLVNSGEVTAAWIYRPIDRTAVVAERGAGAWQIDGETLHRLDSTKQRCSNRQLKGIVSSRFRKEPWRSAIESLGSMQPETSSSTEYVRIATGELDFGAFWTFVPWDHAPASLILSESGGALRAFSTGKRYDARTRPWPHLAVCDGAAWQLLADRIVSKLPEDWLQYCHTGVY